MADKAEKPERNRAPLHDGQGTRHNTCRGKTEPRTVCSVVCDGWSRLVDHCAGSPFRIAFMGLTTKIIDASAYVIYTALALLAIWGVYNAILLYRSLAKKSLANAAGLLQRIETLVHSGKHDAAIAVCQESTFWHSALAQLMAVALSNRDKGIAKIKQLLVMEFHTEVIAGMENRLASISTIVRMGPLLGLLGTVASMIGAFGRIGGSEKVSPNALASDISLALWATGAGLLIATPMMILGNDIHAKLRRLRDRTERQLQAFIDALEEAEPPAAEKRPGSRPGSARAVLPRN
jgi:biopolymer transport protein ExbB